MGITDTYSVVNKLDPESLREYARTAVPFPHVMINDFLQEDFARKVVNSWPSYTEAATMGTEFRSLNERRKVQVTDKSRFPPAMQTLNDALSSPEFVSAVSTVFDIPELLPDPELIGGGLHQTGARGRLDVHVDFNYIVSRKLHRRLNILVYFNENWAPTWGGQLELWNSDVSECIHTIEPIFNRCVIFETSDISFHGVSEVKCPEDTVRRSFASYYYTEAPPAQWDGESRNTVFKARPDESMKGRLMVVQQGFYGLKQQVKKVIRRSSGV